MVNDSEKEELETKEEARIRVVEEGQNYFELKYCDAKISALV